MTLTQRLTRAGATFIVFGVVAAILPQQNGSAQAVTNSADCSGVSVHYRLTEGSAANDTTQASVNHGTSVVVNAFPATNDGPYSATNVLFSYTGGSGNLSPTSGSTTTISTPFSGNYSLSGTFTNSGDNSQHIVSYPIIVN